MKYINQTDYPDWLYVTRTELEEAEREQGKTTTVASSACGLCSAIMVADRLLTNSGFGLKEALKLSYEVKANFGRGTNYQRFAPAFAKKLGLDWEGTDDPDRLRYCLRTGGAAVVHVGGDREGYVGVLSHVGHYVAAISEERDGRIAILDPAYREGKYEERGQKGLVEIQDGVIALCDMQVLMEDTASRIPHFHLFWRKNSV